MEDAAAGGAAATRPYLCHLISNTWFNFRVPELRAVAALAGVQLAIDPAEEATLQEESVFLQVRAADDASVARLAARTVMVRRFVDLWASGDNWETLAVNLHTLAPEVYAAYLAEGTTFKVRVEAFGRAFTEAEKVEQIERLGQLLPFRGKVRLKAPQHSFVLLCDVAKEKPPRLYFGREVASGQRELPGRYDLKRRNYIGTTSLDAELSLLMANLARVQHGHFVCDPYCGTASTLVAAAHFGGRVVGSDLFAPVLHGKLRTRCGPSAKNQPKQQGIGETFSQYRIPAPVGLVHADNDLRAPAFRVPAGGLFDAIITDPPYGMREMSAKLDDAPLTRRTLQPQHVAGHTPRRTQAELEQVLCDLFALADSQLVDGGLLVFLLPCTVPLPTHLHLLPPHPSLEFESLCEQRMAARWSRWCVTMRRKPRAEAPPLPCSAYTARVSPDTLSLFAPPVQRDYRDLTAEVLHPDLLKKSSCHKKRHFAGLRGTPPCAASEYGQPAATAVTAAAAAEHLAPQPQGAGSKKVSWGGNAIGRSPAWSRAALACACAGAALLVWRGLRAR